MSEVLGPDALLALVTAVIVAPPWFSGLQDAIRQYSTMQNYERFSVVDELATRCLFEPLGDETVDPEPSRRSVEEYIEALRATSALARERMRTDPARLFDDAVRALVSPFANDGVLDLAGSAQLAWGTPLQC